MICEAHVLLSSAQAGFIVSQQTVVFCRKVEATVELFFGEFDSGSERTLAAWIRHASRTGTLGVAIHPEGEWRKGE